MSFVASLAPNQWERPKLKDFAIPQKGTQYTILLIDVNGSLASLSEHKGFRKFFVAHANAIGITGTIQRIIQNNVRISVEASSQDILDNFMVFLNECEEHGMISSHEIESEKAVSLPQKTFLIKTDLSKRVEKGKYSDGDEFEKMSESSSNAEVSMLK